MNVGTPANAIGFGYRIDMGPSDPLGVAGTSALYVNYQRPIDPGDGSVFRLPIGNVFRTGTGSVTLNADSTYDGSTTVSSGTLIMGTPVPWLDRAAPPSPAAPPWASLTISPIIMPKASNQGPGQRRHRRA